MRILRGICMFILVAGLSMAARNQDGRHLESLDENAVVVRAAYVDSQGTKWFGTDRGLLRYDNLVWTYYTSDDHLAGNQVHSLTFEKSEQGDELWVGTDGGLSVLAFDADGITGSTSYGTDAGLLNDTVVDVAVDSRGGKFIGSIGGLNWFHEGSMDTIAYLDYYSYIFSGAIRELHIYGDTLYLAQDGGIGRLVSGVDGISGASRWDGDYGVSPYSNDIHSILVKGEEMQYFGSDVGVETHEGYFAKDGWDLLSTDQGLVHNEVIAIAEDAEGGLWFGTQGGLSHLSGGVWTSYTTEDGLLHNTVYDIAFDPDGSVWIATGDGVNRLKDGSFEDFVTAMDERAVTENLMKAWYAASSSVLKVDYLSTAVHVNARLFDIQGKLVQQWGDLPSQNGSNHAELKLYSDLEPGIYIFQLMQDASYSTAKIVIQ